MTTQEQDNVEDDFGRLIYRLQLSEDDLNIVNKFLQHRKRPITQEQDNVDTLTLINQTIEELKHGLVIGDKILWIEQIMNDYNKRKQDRLVNK